MKILILTVDRDDDIGQKLGLRGPIIGRENCLKTAEKLLLKDPTETDANAIFAALKIFDSLDEEKEIAVLTGNINVGYKSDIEIRNQLKKVFEKFNAEGIILVSDGKEDEEVAPIIESFAPIISINRINVSSGNNLKSSFYSIKSFLSRVLKTKTGRRIFFGIPGAIALTYALFGNLWIRYFAGFLGLYLIIKAMHYDESIKMFFDDIKDAILHLNLAIFLYIISIFFILIAIAKINFVKDEPILKNIAIYASNNILFWFYAILTYIIGRILHRKLSKKESIKLFGSGVIIGVFLTMIKQVSMWYLDPTYELKFVLLTLLLGIFVITLLRKYVSSL